jgi:hypothetical protein
MQLLIVEWLVYGVVAYPLLFLIIWLFLRACSYIDTHIHWSAPARWRGGTHGR